VIRTNLFDSLRDFGFPILDNVLELWSLFDFLMPGFLGTEKMFNDIYGKPILASKDPKGTPKDQEAGALAMEALHRQVLPFLLRRLKEDVLSDLPPKIIQDYYCDLSPLQVKLYESFGNTSAKHEIEETFDEDEDQKPKNQKTAKTKQKKRKNKVTEPREGAGHIFQALQYLRKLCDHPLLVLNPQHPKFEEITADLKNSKASLHDLAHSPKLLALKELLHECGIGLPTSSNLNSSSSFSLASSTGSLSLSSSGMGLSSSTGSNSIEGVTSQHRVLVFCQMKAMLDIIESDLLKTHMPNITYLRMDGQTETSKRQNIVSQFNSDPTIDLLLLTTHVGGLGLNLTGADTVIFVEHDWNPMKDLQAMDRAHRLGQKKVVNVYRLITRGTLEEKIMGLQKFKLNIANTVVNKENTSLTTMSTDQLLDLFNYSGASNNPKRTADTTNATDSLGTSENKKGALKSVLESLGELWDESQYEDFDLDRFMNHLKD